MEEEIYHAELADVKRETNILNGLAGTTVAVAIVFLMLGISILVKSPIKFHLNPKKIMVCECRFGKEVI